MVFAFICFLLCEILWCCFTFAFILFLSFRLNIAMFTYFVLLFQHTLEQCLIPSRFFFSFDFYQVLQLVLTLMISPTNATDLMSFFHPRCILLSIPCLRSRNTPFRIPYKPAQNRVTLSGKQRWS